MIQEAEHRRQVAATQPHQSYNATNKSIRPTTGPGGHSKAPAPLPPLPLQQSEQIYENVSQTQLSSYHVPANVQRCSTCGEELDQEYAAMMGGIESITPYYHINCYRCSMYNIQLEDQKMERRQIAQTRPQPLCNNVVNNMQRPKHILPSQPLSNETSIYKPVPLPRPYPDPSSAAAPLPISVQSSVPTPGSSQVYPPPLHSNVASGAKSVQGGNGVVTNGPAYNQNHWLIQEAEHRRQVASSNNQHKSYNNPSGTMPVARPQPAGGHSKAPVPLPPTPGEQIYENMSQAQLAAQQKQNMLSVSGRKKCSSCGDELGKFCCSVVLYCCSSC